MEYVELHCHSNFSFLDLTRSSIILILAMRICASSEDLVAQASKLGYESLALTDHNGLYGVVRFCTEAKRQNIKAIVGSEITLDNGTHLVLLVKNELGYRNLCRLLSQAHLKSEKGKTRVDFDLLGGHAEGLIALSGCMKGEIPEAILKGEEAHAANRAIEYAEIFGVDHFYLELQHHNLPVHEYLMDKMTRLANLTQLPLVATNNVHYAEPKGRYLQDVLTCIKHHTTLDEAGTLLYPNGERFLRPPLQMVRRFAKCPEAIRNSSVIAGRCQFSLDRLATSLPDFEVPERESAKSYLSKLVFEGGQKRYHLLTDRIKGQLEHELKIINRLDLAGYFLIVWDIARFCREKKILCQGRGSAANSAVCYCLRITAVDPIGLNLLFERFLSESRNEPPDIDIDIANNRREEVIQYVYEKYGRDHAAMVCEVISYRGRSAVRDVGKAIGFSVEEVTKLSKVISSYSSVDELPERLEKADFSPESKRVKMLIALCQQIKKFPRHIGIHVGGMIITRHPLSSVVPIENATMPGRSVIQWDKDDSADAGLIKIDLLGLGMLTLIDRAFQLIEKLYGVTIDPAQLPYDDPKVYDLLCSAETVGIFQVESRAQMNTLPRHQPREFYDLVVEVALIRPGPIQGDMVHPYLRRRNGEESVSYPHPSLEPILKRTLGVPLFQEQGMQVAISTAGFSPSEADELRRAMGHKRSRERMEALGDRLIRGMKRNGIKLKEAELIFHQLAAFADFGFAESHAASFALLVYLSAYLKLYYPPVFYCSLLNSQPMGFYSTSTIVYEAQRRGVKMLPVNVNRSRYDCTVEEDSVRLGYRYLKSFGESVHEKLDREIERSDYKSIRDFINRVELSRSAFEQLAMSGAFDCFVVTRRQALWEILAVLNVSQGELGLEMEPDMKSASRLPQMTTVEEIASDFKSMGLSPGEHPMSLVRSFLKREGILCANDLYHINSGQPVVVAGAVVIRQRPMTAKGFMFVTLEDEFGFLNVVVKPDLFKKYRDTLVMENALIVKGILEKRDGVINIIGKKFIPLRPTKDQADQIDIKSRDFR